MIALLLSCVLLAQYPTAYPTASAGPAGPSSRGPLLDWLVRKNGSPVETTTASSNVMTASADDAAACFKLAQKQSNFVKLNFIQFHESEFGNTCNAFTIDPLPTNGDSSWKASPQMTTYYRDPKMTIAIIVVSGIAGVSALIVILSIIITVVHKKRSALASLDSGQASMVAPLLMNTRDSHIASSSRMANTPPALRPRPVRSVVSAAPIPTLGQLEILARNRTLGPELDERFSSAS